MKQPYGRMSTEWMPAKSVHIMTANHQRPFPLLSFLFLSSHLAKSYILKLSPKLTCYTTNTVSDVYLFSLVFIQFTYFPQDVSEIHTMLHSTELQLILHYDVMYFPPLFFLYFFFFFLAHWA